jgi:hypothetical protein
VTLKCQNCRGNCEGKYGCGLSAEDERECDKIDQDTWRFAFAVGSALFRDDVPTLMVLVVIVAIGFKVAGLAGLFDRLSLRRRRDLTIGFMVGITIVFAIALHDLLRRLLDSDSPALLAPVIGALATLGHSTIETFLLFEQKQDPTSELGRKASETRLAIGFLVLLGLTVASIAWAISEA